jgi:N-methylhydantoinase A
VTWSVGVDIGGTFTDFCAEDARTGRVHLAKRPSTPDDPGRALLAGLEDLARAGVDLDGVHRLAHGTTVATNALIERRGGKVALLTTRGFRDLLEIGRQIRPHMYDLHANYPPPVVPRPRRFEVDERITAGGRILRPLTEPAIARAVADVGASGADGCAVCLLFAFANPEHERRLGAALATALPDLKVSLSSEVQPEFREYERFSTTTLNAYLQPVMDEYLARLEAGLAARVPRARLGINQSSGGLMSPPRARAFPVRTALSGPAAGVVGALEAATGAGVASFITLDMGGTSADVSLVRDGRAAVALEREVAGFPIRLPSVDIQTVGAGGGSVAWFDIDGLLKVGPQSAGATPGPACYGLGGTRPTVTDANLLLGRLSDRGLLGGRMRLEPRLAREAFAPLSRRLGYSDERVAQGVIGIVVANMVRAIRTISVERGYDPRGLALVPFGGAGPLHARDVAAALAIGRLIVPPAPGIVCAQGLLIADLKEDFVLGQRMTLTPANDASFTAVLEHLRGEAIRWFQAEGVAADRAEIEVNVDARYVGQNFELRVPVAIRGALAAPIALTLAALRERFLAVHETAYGYANPDDPVEIVNTRLTGLARVRTAAPHRGAEPPAAAPVPAGRRPVWFDAAGPCATPVYAREALATGHRIRGPAVIEQLDATTLVFPHDTATVDDALNLVIDLDAPPAPGACP